ncbi:MAG: glycosyltransferase [Planctomycetota bacterium]|nr:glycosyltransferase [Planctomycetota bacterium]
MRIVQYCRGVVPPVAYGGIERLVHWLTREFVRQGHAVTVMAPGASEIESAVPGARLVALPEDIREHIALVPKDADVLHSHNHPPVGLPDVPFIVTEHGNRRRRFDYAPNTVFVSRRHAQTHGGELFVYNGIPLEDYALQERKDPFMVFMAKVAWRAKNAKTAIHLSFDSGTPLKMAGGDPWRSRKMWGLWMLRALYRGDLLDVVGDVGGAEKLELLQKAKLLFFAVNWQEPFGLAPHEALACGTPVLVSPNGALPEYIEDGRNGFVARSYGEAVAKVRRVAAMGADETAELAHRCRESALTMEACARNYLELYERVLHDRYLYPPERAAQLRFKKPRSTIIKCRWPRRL